MDATTSYLIKEAGESSDAVFVCTAMGPVTVDIMWRKTDESSTDEPKAKIDLTANAAQGDYGNGQRVSTLTLADLTIKSTSDSIECYDAAFLSLTATMKLDVFGKDFFLSFLNH